MIDLEASSVTPHSTPIEVAVAIWPGPSHPIEVWSSLIRPTQEWVLLGDWDDGSADLHGIAQAELQKGVPVETAAPCLNTLAAPSAFSDAASLDSHWIDKLFAAAGISRRFEILPFDLALAELEAAQWYRQRRFVERNAPRHRAADDATRLLRALARAINVDVHVIRHDLAAPLPASR
ncbi:3'-5' exonuclease [Ancylobacter polymorphus]|uniref:3'-5' exonuclease n=1 Tax=Ancylobacter polymorphus TaxID=223390 RepID=A0A9E7A5J0_9HYPH|nr:3'-5' exonuclease [Ancylobacter polymorphus]UOK73525.1 3'-5' exonuclease [Ancylobacter polymorphus]